MSQKQTLTFLLAFLCLLGTIRLTAQCDLMINAGPDQSVCNTGGNVRLQGTAGGSDLLCYEWLPAAGLSDPTIINPIITGSGTRNYTLFAYAADPANNLLINGDFDQGRIGWTTDYRPGNGGSFGLLSNEGRFAIATNAASTHSNFAACTDHTGGGNQLVVNGARFAGEEVYCQRVNVAPNTKYGVSAWLQSVESQNPARLQFSVNGALLGGIFTASSTTCDWRNFCQTWNSGAATSAEVCIVNQNTNSTGNDFALDDIFFGPFCETTDEVVVTVAGADAVLDDETVYPCNADPAGIVLDGSASSTGIHVSYSWTTTDGNIVSGANTPTPLVNALGNYVLTVTYNDGMTVCTDQAFTEVIADPAAVSAVASAPDPLTCDDDEVRLSAAGSTGGFLIIYAWSTDDGNFTGLPFGNRPRVDEPGRYLLTVIRIGGCQDTASVVVAEDRTPPRVVIADPDPLPCGQTARTLDATASDATNVDIGWSTADGRLTGGATTLTPSIDRAGTYRLTLTDRDNGCSEFSEVRVEPGTVGPPPPAPPVQEMGCAPATYALRADDPGPGFTAAWTTADGNFVSRADTLTPVVDTPGDYVLAVTETATGCVGTTTVEVRRGVLGAAIALQSNPRTCARRQIVLQSSHTAGEPLDYQWTTADGSILNGATTPNPTVDAAGTYTLTVTGRSSNCSESASVEVVNDFAAPPAEAGPDTSITCLRGTVNLRGTTTATDPGLDFSWATPDGMIDAGADRAEATVSAPGRYFLTVTNPRNGCFTTDSLTVADGRTPPLITAGPDRTLTCVDTAFVVGGGTVIFGVDYSWTSPNGNFVGSPDQINVMVDAAGTYSLEAFDPATGCTGRDTAVISVDTTRAELTAAPAPPLTCNDPAVRLPVELRGDAEDYALDWIGPGLTGAADTLRPLVAAAGTYRLLARHLTTGCRDSLDLVVADQRFTPAAVATSGDVLTCRTTTVTLDGEGSLTGPDVAYSWMDAFENEVSDSLTAVVDAPGVYTFTVLDRPTGCTATDTTRVSEDRVPPALDLNPTPARITCAEPSVTLNPGAEQMPLFLYEWTYTEGNQSPTPVANSPTISVGAAGTYSLLIVNPLNGCETRGETVVVADVDPPAAVLPDTLDLGCDTIPFVLPAEVSNLADLSLRWTTAGGTVLAATEHSPARGRGVGDYFLEVVDLTNGCTGQDTLTAIQDLPVAFEFLANDPTCRRPLGSIDFLGVTGGNGPYLFSVDGGRSFMADTAFGELPAGNYALAVQDFTGCELRDTVLLNRPREIVTFLPERVSVELGDAYRIDLQTSFDDLEISGVLWRDSTYLDCGSCLRPLARPLGDRRYTVDVESTDGCTATATIFLAVERNYDVYFPDAFSPNGDGLNDVFLPLGDARRVVRIRNFGVYDRWGAAVHFVGEMDVNQAPLGWDGRARGRLLDPGVFVYSAEVEFLDGEVELFKGEVVLLR